MSDPLDRQPMDNTYDHTTGTMSPAPQGPIDRAIEAAKQYLGIGQPKGQGAGHVMPDGSVKTPAQIADEMSK